MLKKLKNPDVTKALGNLGWLGFERFVQVAAAIIVSGLIARYFGPELYGKWQYANTVLQVLTPLTWVCGGEILVPTILQTRQPSQNSPHTPTLGAILGSAFALRFTVSLVALLISWGVLATGRFDPMVSAMLAGLALTLLFREPFAVITVWLQSQTHSKPALIINVTAALIKSSLVYVLVRTAVEPSRFGWLWAAEAALIGTGLVIYFVRHNGGKLGWRVEPALFKRFVSAGSIFWLGLVCMYLFLKIDRLILQHFVSYGQLGHYAAAQQLNENWITLAMMLSQTLAPAFVYRIADQQRLGRNMIRLMFLAGILMALGAVILDLLAGVIVRHVFGPAFSETIPIFRWAVWLSVPAAVEAMGNLLVLKYQARYVLVLKWVCALLVALAVDAIMIPLHGGYGALAGLACGYLSAVAVNLCYFRYRMRP